MDLENFLEWINSKAILGRMKKENESATSYQIVADYVETIENSLNSLLDENSELRKCLSAAVNPNPIEREIFFKTFQEETKKLGIN